MKLQEKILTAESKMNEHFFERQEEIRLMFLALLSREHLLFIGPPGTGKSNLLNSLSNLFQGSKFSILLNKYVTADELIGPVKIKKLKEDIYERDLKNKIGDVDFAFVDEIFKGNAAILNTLLNILNERKLFNNGYVSVPLKLMMSASNELPNSEFEHANLSALYDRLLIRKMVEPIKNDSNILKLVQQEETDLTFDFVINAEELENAHEEIMQVKISNEFTDALLNSLKVLRKENVFPSDRRIKKAMKVCKAHAWLFNKTSIGMEEGSSLNHIFWDTMENGQLITVQNVIKENFKVTEMTFDILTREYKQVLHSIDYHNTNSMLQKSKALKDILGDCKSVKSNDYNKIMIDNLAEEIKTEINKLTEKVTEKIF